MNYQYPQKSKIILKYIDGVGYKIECNGMEFSRVYRYIGGNDDE